HVQVHASRAAPIRCFTTATLAGLRLHGTRTRGMDVKRVSWRSPVVARLHAPVIAIACIVLLAVILTGPALVGRAALRPDRPLDWDPLYRKGPPPPLPDTIDYSPIVLDYPGDLAFARGLGSGRLDSWNPLVGAGAPLWAEHTGPFFPLKVPFYAAPSRATY